MVRNAETLKLTSRLSTMAADGLLDVKFFVRNPDEAMAESVCREANRLFEAVERNEAAVLDFRDGRSQ